MLQQAVFHSLWLKINCLPYQQNHYPDWHCKSSRQPDLSHYKSNIKQEIRDIEEQYFNNWVVRHTKYTNYYIEDISFSRSQEVEVVVVYYSLYNKLRFRATYTISAPDKENQYLPTCYALGIVEDLSTGKNIRRDDFYKVFEED